MKTLFNSTFILSLCIALIINLFPLLSTGQNSCQNATVIAGQSVADSLRHYYVSGIEVWFIFQATDDSLLFQAVTPDSLPVASVPGIHIYSGSCGDLTEIWNSEYELIFTADSITENDYYYIQVFKEDTSSAWVSFYLTNELIPAEPGNFTVCASCFYQENCITDKWMPGLPNSGHLISACIDPYYGSSAVTLSLEYETEQDVLEYLLLHDGSYCYWIFDPAAMPHAPSPAFAIEWETSFTSPGFYLVYFQVVDPLIPEIFEHGPYAIYISDPLPETVTVHSSNNNTCNGSTQFWVNALSGYAYYKWEVLVNNYSPIILPSNQGVNNSSVTINWYNINQLPSSFYVKVTINPMCCNSSGMIKIFKCCFTEQPTNQQLFNQTVSTNTTFTGDKYVMGDLILDANATIAPASVWQMGPMSRILVKPGKTLTIEGDIQIMQGCNYMWDGIYCEDITAQVILDSDQSGQPLIANAVNAVVSRYGGFLSIDNCLFEDNYISITIRDYYEGSPSTYQSPYPGHIRGSTFTNTDQSNFNLQYQPFQNSLSYAGIYLENVKEINIGIPEATNNTFSFLRSGIFGINSRITITGNEFLSIPPVYLDTWPPDFAAVFVKGQSPVPFQPMLTLGQDISPSTPAYTNTFEDCRYAVHARKNNCTIVENHFSYCPFSIHCLETKQLSIERNLIENEGNESLNLGGTGITVMDPVPPTKLLPANILIRHNRINGKQTGISVINEVGFEEEDEHVRIMDNEIVFFENTTKLCFHTGINCENSEYAEIVNNTVHRASSTSENEKLLFRGIRISRTCNAWVANDTVTNMGVGIQTNGELFYSQFPCNELNDCIHGFWIGEGTTMTNQGVSDIWNTKNRWDGNYTDPNFKLSALPANLSNFTQISWYEYSGYNDINKVDAELNDPQSGHPLYDYILPTMNIDADLCAGSAIYQMLDSIGDTTIREYYFGSIVRDENYYQWLDPQYHSWEKSYFYRQVSQDTSMLFLGGKDDSLYMAVYDSLRTHNPGLLDQFRQCIEQRQFTLATYINDNLDISQLWDQCSQDANAILLNNWVLDSYFYSYEDSLRLMEIAMLTPYEGGDAVYTSRILLNLDYESLGTPYTAPVKPEKPNSVSAVSIKPNPASDMITISFAGEASEKQAVLKLYNAAGQFMISWPVNLSPGNQYIKLDNVKAGLYIYRFEYCNATLGFGKLCVIK